MCTLGAVFERGRGRVLVFKQCDLAEPVAFAEPELRLGKEGIRYVVFERNGRSQPWAGFNDQGVGFVAADAYLDPETNPPFEPQADALEAYAEMIASCRTAEEAAAHMREVYQGLGAPDMILVADGERAFLLECSPTCGVGVVDGEEGHLASTNHFRTLPGAVTEVDNPSTYRRLERAEQILSQDPSIAGIEAVLRDEADGASELSICRTAQTRGEYFTQASVVFALGGGGRVDCMYLLNGNPNDTPFTGWRDAFGESERVSPCGLDALDE